MSYLSGTFLATLSLRDLYFQWESAGIFEFFLPALLIFAVIFGVLSATNILGGNKGINFIISVAIAVIAIRTPLVSSVFSELLPNFAIGLVFLVVVVILMGLFVNKGNLKVFSNTLMWGGLGIGVIVMIIVLNNYDWFGSFWWQENWTSILWIVILVLLLAPLLSGKKKEEESKFELPFGPFRAKE